MTTKPTKLEIRLVAWTTVLLVTAVAQSLAIAAGSEVETTPVLSFISPGDQLVGLSEMVPPGESEVLVLAFSPTCVHCVAIAPKWGEWLAAYDERPVIAVTTAPAADAQKFARDNGWTFPAVTIEEDEEGTRVTTRVPWVFLINREGQVLSQGHGSLAEKPSTLVPSR